MRTGLPNMRANFRVGEWIVRPRRDCIERGDEIVHIHPRPMAVLECLAAAGGEVVTRDELFNTVWPGVIVTDDALTQCVVELRHAFGDDARDPQVIETVPKVGFRLMPPVIPVETGGLADSSGGADSVSTRDSAPQSALGRTSVFRMIAGALLLIVLAVSVWTLRDRPPAPAPSPDVKT